MTTCLIHNTRAMNPGVGLVGTSVLVEDGRIAAIDPDVTPPTAEQIDGGGRLLTPGLIDIHTHGIERYCFERSADDLRNGLRRLPAYGVTTVLPTLYRVMHREAFALMRELTAALDTDDGAYAPGFHLEGPFLALPGAGAETLPGDTELLEALFDVTDGRVSAMSISPDTANILPIIERLAERGVKPFITHTHASVEQGELAIDAGAHHATHFYDVFPVPAVTEPGVRPVGVVEAILADDRVSVDFICDGVHVHPTAIRAALAAKGPEKVLLITDANIGAGLGDGEHDTPWGFPVRVARGDAARTHLPGDPKHGTLAGSALTMNVGIENLRRWLKLPEHDIWAMGSRSVADRMRLTNKGRLETGADADLVLWDDADDRLSARKTWVAGRLVHDTEATPVRTQA